MKAILSDQLTARKSSVAFRTDPHRAPAGREHLSESPVHYELARRTQAVPHSGLGLVHQVSVQSGIIKAINSVSVLKRQLPYSESDHVLSMAYNALSGGTALEHIEHLRCDPTHSDMLGVHSIPDPTTAGDFCRRFESQEKIDELQDAIMLVRMKMWRRGGIDFSDEIRIDVDGTLVPTTGECKEGADFSYKGDFSYHPLIISCANTGEILYIVNRSGNRPSHEDAHFYIDKVITHLRKAGYKKIRIRGDTDFTQTAHLDRWNRMNVKFVFGIDARQGIVKLANSIPESSFIPIERCEKHVVKTKPRTRRENAKARIVRERGYRNQTQEAEWVAERTYTPAKCEYLYRLIILRKRIAVSEGEILFPPEFRYFFYLTNDWNKDAEEIVYESNDRCNQENLIGQLKSDLGAMRMPLDNLLSNGAYMVFVALAWTLKAWTAMSLPCDSADHESRSHRQKRKKTLLRMDFTTFLRAMIMIPGQVIRSGRRIIVRLLNMNDWTEDFFAIFNGLRRPLRL